MQKTGIALAGTGAAHAFDFARKIRESDTAYLTGIFTGEPAEAEKRMPGVHLYHSYEELLRDPEAEGIIITSAMKDHCHMILEAAQYGRAVFAENGLCMDEDEAHLIRYAVKKNDICFVLSDPVRKPPFLVLKKWMEEKICGETVSVHVHMAGSSGLTETFRPGQAYLMPFSEGHGHHACAMLAWLLGRPLYAGAAGGRMSAPARNSGAFDNAAALFVYESGVTGILQMSAMESSRPYEAWVFCTDGMLYASKTEAGYRRTGGQWTVIGKEDWPQPYPYILDEWTRCIRENREPEMYGIDDAVMIAEMYSAVQTAFRQTVRIGDSL